MRYTSNQAKAEEIQTLMKYFEHLPDGEEITWDRIEIETHVSMGVDGHGRDHARRALRKLKRPYEALNGQGIRLSAVQTAMTILRGRFCRIDGAVRVADRTQRELSERHLAQMAQDEQRRMLLAAGFFGAIRAYAKEARTKLLK